MRRAFPILLTVLAVALFVTAVRAAEEEYPNISINDLKAHIASNDVTILDANGTDSYRDGHIPGAIDFDADSSKLQSMLPSDKSALIVAYCGGPQCMAYKAAAAKAMSLGYTNVKHLTAGISGWKDAGEKVDKAG